MYRSFIVLQRYVISLDITKLYTGIFGQNTGKTITKQEHRTSYTGKSAHNPQFRPLFNHHAHAPVTHRIYRYTQLLIRTITTHRLRTHARHRRTHHPTQAVDLHVSILKIYVVTYAIGSLHGSTYETTL